MYFLYFYHVCFYLFIYSYHIHLYSYTFLYMLLLSDGFILYFLYCSILLTLTCLYYAYPSCTCAHSCALSSFTISIILIIYAFLSCVPRMFHRIHFGMSIIYSYHIRCIYISFFIYFSFTFMFMFMFMFIFQFVFMFHIIFMFSCSSMNLLYLKIGIVPIDSSNFKLWHFHAN